MKYIVEICVSIYIGIFTIAYPLIITEINKMGYKYKSNYLPDIFRSELIKPFKRFRYSFFKLLLALTIILFVFLFINVELWLGWNNVFINNSAELIVLILTILLVYSFVVWISKVALYTGKPLKLLEHFIKKYKKFSVETEKNEESLEYLLGEKDLLKEKSINKKEKKREEKTHLLKTINDLAYYSIRNQDTHLQEKLRDFYKVEFKKYRDEYSNELDKLEGDRLKKLKEKGVEYPADLYYLVYGINLEALNNKSLLKGSLENILHSLYWLFWGEHNPVKISELTYIWLWKILRLNLDKEQNIQYYWSKADQYVNFAFNVEPKYEDGKTGPINEDEIKSKEDEKDRFLEFNYTLGGLLLQQGKYELLNYILKYSSSSLPNYLLLPQSIDDIFNWFHKFSSRLNETVERRIENFRFPDLDNYGVSHKIRYCICSYICLLYIRQFSLLKYLSFQNHTGIPTLPDDKRELKERLEKIPFFRRCLEDLMSKEELLHSVGLNEIVKEKRDTIEEHLSKVEKEIKEKLAYIKEVKKLSKDKLNLFNKTSAKIIKNALKKYNDILIDYDKNDEKTIYQKNLRWVVNGRIDLMSKSAFVEDDIPLLNFHEFLANSIVDKSINNRILNSFIAARTEKHLIYKENILAALSSILSKVPKKVDIKIIGFNIDYKLKEIFEKSSFKVKINYKHFTQQYPYPHSSRNFLFILNKDDLPRIYKKDISEDEKKKYQLKVIDEELKLYSSVLELNKHQELNAGYNKEDLNNEPKLQVALLFNWFLLWKKDRRIIQIVISDPSLEQGFESDFKDISPI